MIDIQGRARRGEGRPRGRWAPLALVLLIVLAAAALAGPAAAAPAEPTLSLDELQARLDSGPVTGYFLTVDQGAHIATVPMTVLSIAGGAGPDGALIMFAADMADPLMERIGTIASGMSGSPLYVDDAGTDKLIGALSYGDIFTLGGLALATPIEYMSAVEDRFGAVAVGTAGAVRTVSLEQPLSVPGDGIVGSVAVVTSAKAARAVRKPGVAVFAPLAAVQLGGLPVKSRAYAELSAALQKRGHTVVSGLGSGPGGWDPEFTTPLVGGAALAVMYTRGDLWAGGIGTVTYINDDRLVAFGHSMDWAGPTALYLCNAQIDGIWANSLSAYKLGTPGAVRGAISEDRGSAVAGLTGAGPAEVPVTSSATAELETTASATSTTWITRKWAGDPWGSFLAAVATTVPAYKAADRAYLPGSAETATTVVVSDGEQQYTVQRANVWDDPWDVLWVMSGDVSYILDTLAADPYGIAHADVVSVDFAATLSDARRLATVTDVTVPGGLRTGSNTITVTVDVFGQPEPLTIPVTLVLPVGTPREGYLMVSSATDGREDGEAEPEDGTSVRRTLAETVADLNAAPANDEVQVTFLPMPLPGPEPFQATAGDVLTEFEPVSTTVATGLVVTGGVAKPTAGLTLSARPARVLRYRRTTITGSFMAGGDTAVRVYRQYRGEAKRVLVATVPAFAMDGMAGFAYRSERLRKAALFTVVWAGDASTLGATARVSVNLRR
ncbi:MAG: hypothetical protein WC709_02865 [Thermoleophilia bacterium]